MILLDSKVVFETLRPAPEPRVVHWIDEQIAETLFFSSVSVADGQIAAIARAQGFSVATRDTAPFRAAGVPVIDPWATV